MEPTTPTPTTTAANPAATRTFQPQVSYQRSIASAIGINKGYLSSIAGILRFFLILFYFGAWVSAASIPKVYNGRLVNLDGTTYGDIRSAFLFFTVVGFVGSLFLYLLVLLSVTKLTFLSKIPWIILVFISDALWILPMFVLSILCAVKESELRNAYTQTYLVSAYYNIGAFAASAFFGFVVTILLLLDGVFHFLKLKRDGFGSSYQ